MSKPEPAAGRLEPSPSASRAAWELAGLIIMVETIMWVVPLTPNPRLSYACIAILVAVFLAVCHIRDGISAGELGFRFDNLPRVIRRIALPLGAFILMVVVIGLAAGTLRFGAKFYSMLLFVPLWALLQQYMLLAFANRRLRVIVGWGKSSVIATAALFALLHLPNPVLTLACAYGGYIWAREYERSPNLFANALTHAVASAFLANSLPRPLLKNMVVGLNYFFR